MVKPRQNFKNLSGFLFVFREAIYKSYSQQLFNFPAMNISFSEHPLFFLVPVVGL